VGLAVYVSISSGTAISGTGAGGGQVNRGDKFQLVHIKTGHRTNLEYGK